MASKVLFVFAVLSACCIVCWGKPASAGVRIYNDGRYLHCDTLVCPEPTEKCIVSGKTSERDPRMIETWRRCLDRDGRVIAEDKKIDNNPNPNEAYSVHVESARDGTVTSSSSSASAGSGNGDIYYPPPRTSKSSAGTLQLCLGLYISMLLFILNKF